nr:hypothetical protein GCM10020093_070460 [Planobispora longispora]
MVQLPQVFDPVAVAQAEAVLTALGKADVPRAVFNPGMPLPPPPSARLSSTPGCCSATACRSGWTGRPWSVPPGRTWRTSCSPGRYGGCANAASWPTRCRRRPRTVGDARRPGRRRRGGAGRRPAPARLVVSGPEPVTGDRLAAAVAAATGLPVGYTQVDPAEYGRLIEPVMGAAAAAGIAGIYAQSAAAPPRRSRTACSVPEPRPSRSGPPGPTGPPDRGLAAQV